MVSSTRIDRINSVIKRTNLIRYSNGMSIPKGMKAAIFPKPTKFITVGCRRSDKSGSLKKPSGRNMNVYSEI
ncbi:hypothetical protein D3C81_1694510 [compost metagenome]